MDRHSPEITISTQYADIDREFVVRELQNSYWANTRSKEMILLSLSHSLCYCAFLEGKQIGFIRVVTDYSTFAYLCDAVITRDYQGQGVGKKIIETLLRNPDLSQVKWLLRTKDAHGLYEKFGFIKTQRPDRYMEK